MKDTRRDITSIIFDRVDAILGIDVRSLGFFRVILGSLILIDLIIRAGSLGAHYTDLGVVPRELIYAYAEQPVLLSLHMLSGGIYWQAILFVFAGLSAIAFTLGYHTRLAAVMCWVLTLSMHIRNPFLNDLGDWLLVDLLFWGMFLPLGARFSLDSHRKGGYYPGNPRVLSLATLGILLQVCLLYFFSVYHKNSPDWHTEGTAVYYALSLDRITTAIGRRLLSAPEIWLHGLTFATIWLERFGPVLAFFPWFTTFFRCMVVVMFMGFHAGLAITMTLGIFPYICIAAWILFIPSAAWEKMIQHAPGWAGELERGIERKLEKAFRSGGNHLSRHNAYVLNPVELMVAFFGLFFTLSSNLLYTGKMGEGYYQMVYRYIEPVGNSINMRQRWNMFSPFPPRHDGWYVAYALLEDGEVVDVLAGGRRVDWSRPDDIAATYINQRWRKYYEWVMNKWDPHARYLSRYQIKKWESKDTRQIKYWALYFMEEATLEQGESTNVVRKRLYVRE